ncbi:MAG: dodecin domain-containing protein [Sulfurimonas sp.]|nr:MAG: dodecin domain-containing protein [Sulfurimonas sp.]
MSQVVKVIEVLAQSKKSWEDAADKAVKKASKSINNIKSVHIVSMNAKVVDNTIVKYRINAKISFVIGDK